MDRRRSFAPDHREHLGDARRDGTSYSPALTHADLDAVVGRFAATEQGRDGYQHTPGIVMPDPSAPGNPPIVVDSTRPCSVTGLAITHGSNEHAVWVELSWSRGSCSNNGTKFEVRLVRTDDPVESQFPIVRMVTTTSVRFENLEPATPYEATVTAISYVNIRSSESTLTFTSTTDSTIPSNVGGLTMSAGLRTVVLSWTDVVDADVINGNGTYEVQLATNSGFSSGLRTARKSGTVHSWGDLSPNTTYYARVRAVDSSGNTSASWSSTVSATTGQAGTQDIAADAITANLIQADAITASKIDAGAVTTSKLAADSVTAAKLASIVMEVGKYIQSTTYSSGVSGWRINASGSAEFANIIARGTIISDNFQTASSGARVRMGDALTEADEVQFIGPSGGIGSIRNGEFVSGYSNSMRLSAGGIIDLYYDGSNKVKITAAGGVDIATNGELSVNDTIDITSGGLKIGGTTVITSGRDFQNISDLTAGTVSAFEGTFGDLVFNGDTVSRGASDSGGSGYRVLRVPN